ncbi:MAG: DNA mismatch repair endonuclease MutL [bacterium]
MPFTIKVLPDNLINMIAAGEVIERPASIVKELIENSIDAGSTRIDIFIEGSGKRAIKVVDNGCGMDYENAQRAIQRHATSKIESVEDLLAINSFGFRGEALPSIAAVSRFVLTTRSALCKLATQIDITGGKISEISQTAFPIGTQIEIKDLFLNIPARAKFLKSDSTELSHIIHTVIRESIPRPDISFSLRHNGRSLLDLPVTAQIFERIYRIHGEEYSKELIPIDKKEENISIKGFISSPSIHRPDCQSEYLYINKRYIRNLPIQKIIHQSYGSRLSHGRYPLFILEVDLERHQVDVNVHPAKLEARFSNIRQILRIINETIREALNKAQPDTHFMSQGLPKQNYNIVKNEPIASYTRTYSHSPGLFKTPAPVKSPSTTKSSVMIDPSPPLMAQKDTQDIFVVSSPFFHFRSMFIIYESKAGLTMVDQHAAHERINYEKFESLLLKRDIPRQNLITSPIITISPDEEVLLDEALPLLKELGFEMEIFGSCSLILRTVPLYFKADPAPLLTEIFDQIKEMRDTVNKTILIKPMAAKMACHNSIKAGESIKNEEMALLINQLSLSKEPFFCPHGRPTILNMTLPEIEKKFGRIL